MIAAHPTNCDILASKVLGEEPQVEPALNSILRVILRTPSMQEFLAADLVFKSFCEVVIVYLLVQVFFSPLPLLSCIIYFNLLYCLLRKIQMAKQC